MRSARGFTLIEMLVVLVIFSLVSTLLIQGLGFFLDLRWRVTEHLDQQRVETLRHHWYRQTVAGLTPEHPTRRDVFAGEKDQFSGLTLAGLGSRPGVPIQAQWSLVRDGSGLSLRYRQGQNTDWQVAHWPQADAHFEYLGDDDTWHPQWPPEESQSGWQLPRAIRIAFSPPQGLPWLAAPRGRPFPRPELQDFL